MGDEPSKLEWDLLAWEDSIESERERIGEIKDRLEKIEEKLDEIRDEKPSLVASLRTIFSWRNYSVYLELLGYLPHSAMWDCSTISICLS